MLWRLSLTVAVVFAVVALVAAAADRLVPVWWFGVLFGACVIAAVKWPESDR